MLYFNNNSQVNIDEIYKTSISKIDGFKSSNYIYADEISKNNIFKPSESPNLTSSYLEISSLYKRESRAHAFYRIIGLPVTDGNDFFNPGFDTDLTKDQKKIDICNKYLKSNTYSKYNIYQKIFDKSNLIVDVFNENDINANVLLLSLINDRKFSEYIKYPDTNPLDIKDEYLEYSVEMRAQNKISYLDYSYVKDGPKPNLPAGLGETRSRFIMPFIPDPKICFSVGEKSQVYVPFFNLKGADSPPKFTFPAAGIDLIFQERFSKSKTSENTTETEKEAAETLSKLVSTLEKSKYSKSDIEAINQSSNSFLKDKNIFYFNFINFAKNLLKVLKENINTAREIQKFHHILPTSTVDGPEKGLGAKPIYALSEYNEIIEHNIVLETRIMIVKSIGNIYEKDEKKPVINTNNAIAGVPTPAKDDVKDEEKESTLDRLNKERAGSVQKMLEALKYIEILTGEFSGFGIIDMHVITSALYLMDPGAIASFLDEDSYKRAQAPEFNINLPEKTLSVIDAYKKLAETARTLYLTLDALYLSIE